MPVRSRVAEVIKEAIFSGGLKPGDPLRELHLAADLNVSQASVREALVQLENAGMVTRIRNKETIVTKLTPDDVRERLMIREALEILAWIEAAKRMGAEDYGKLYIAVEAISAAVESNDYYGLAVSDLEFHRSIWQSSRQPTLCRTLEQTTAPLFAFVTLIHVIQQDRLKETVNSHEAVIRALRDGRPRVLRSVLREHLAGSYDRFLNSGRKDFRDWYAASATSVV